MACFNRTFSGAEKFAKALDKLATKEGEIPTDYGMQERFDNAQHPLLFAYLIAAKHHEGEAFSSGRRAALGLVGLIGTAAAAGYAFPDQYRCKPQATDGLLFGCDSI